MTEQNDGRQPLVADADVRDAIERHSDAAFGRPRRVERVLRRELSPYSTSFAIEEIDLLLDGGERLNLVFKNLGDESLVSDARAVRPSFMYRPARPAIWPISSGLKGRTVMPSNLSRAENATWSTSMLMPMPIASVAIRKSTSPD